jgi:hypothetical protein
MNAMSDEQLRLSPYLNVCKVRQGHESRVLVFTTAIVFEPID